MLSYSKNIEPTIAVLPFENLTENNNLQILCEGFTYDIMMELSKFKQFQILFIDTSSTDNKAGRNSEVLSKTDYHLKGSFRNFNNRLRINAHLIETKSQRLVWADRLENDVDEIFSIQEHLLYQIVAALQDKLDMDLLSKIHKFPDRNIKAYEFWLYGMNELKKGTHVADLAAREQFEKAIELDSKYSLAYSGISLSYFNEWSCQVWHDWDSNMNGAREWAKKAIELDDQNYIANLIAGKIHVFEKDYTLGEILLKKAEHLNPNDPFNLIQISSSYIYLGLLREAEQLYLRALKLRPYRQQDYHMIGAWIYFELGEFEKTIELGEQYINAPWVDYPAIIAAAHYFLGNIEKAKKYWDLYIDNYIDKIKGTSKISEEDALQWMIDFNPFKGETRLEEFWGFISNGIYKPKRENYVHSLNKYSNSFLLTGEVWSINFKGKKVQLVNNKGLQDIAVLLSKPNESIHCSQLMGSVILEKGSKVLDAKAKKDYQKRIAELHEQLQEAKEYNLSSAETLQSEYDYLIDHLSQSLNIKGEPRNFQVADDKARSAVTQRIRSAIKKIDKVHHELAVHLTNSLKTGNFCCYSTSENILWEL